MLYIIKYLKLNNNFINILSMYIRFFLIQIQIQINKLFYNLFKIFMNKFNNIFIFFHYFQLSLAFYM